jgi:protein phosphatase
MKASETQTAFIGRRTDVGRVRTANEDNMGDIPVPNGHALIVADGMGGYRGGALASRLVVETMEEFFRDAQLNQPKKALRQAVFLANERVYLRGRQEEELSRMGSTCVVALVQGRDLYTAHVGDSRIYFLRPGEKMQQVTRDHTVVQHFVDVGLLSPEEAEDHPDSHILSRALGPRPHVEADVIEEAIQLQKGDRLLLCSDGLTKMMNDQEIESYLNRQEDIQELADRYVQRANELGGEDNVTVIVYEHLSEETTRQDVTQPIPGGSGSAAWKEQGPLLDETQEFGSDTGLSITSNDIVEMPNTSHQVVVRIPPVVKAEAISSSPTISRDNNTIESDADLAIRETQPVPLLDDLVEEKELSEQLKAAEESTPEDVAEAKTDTIEVDTSKTIETVFDDEEEATADSEATEEADSKDDEEPKPQDAD